MVQRREEEVSFSYTDKQTKRLGWGFIWLVADSTGLSQTAHVTNAPRNDFIGTQVL
jgi:hypothetical protein